MDPAIHNSDLHHLQRLIAQDSILRTITLMKKAEDTLDGNLFKSLLHPTKPITFDLTQHLPHVGITHLTPDEFWDKILHALGGFTATQHVMSNPLFEFEGQELTTAKVSIYMTAYHAIEGEDGKVESVTGRGVQESKVELLDGRWVLSSMKVLRDCPLDNGGLYATAAQRVEKGLGRKAKAKGLTG